MQQILLICLRLDFQYIAVSLRAKYGSIHVTVSFYIKILQLQLRKIILSPSTAEGDTTRTQKLECQVIFYHWNKKHKRWEDGKTKKNSLVFAFYKLATKSLEAVHIQIYCAIYAPTSCFYSMRSICGKDLWLQKWPLRPHIVVPPDRARARASNICIKDFFCFNGLKELRD